MSPWPLKIVALIGAAITAGIVIAYVFGLPEF